MALTTHQAYALPLCLKKKDILYDLFWFSVIYLFFDFFKEVLEKMLYNVTFHVLKHLHLEIFQRLIIVVYENKKTQV